MMRLLTGVLLSLAAGMMANCQSNAVVAAPEQKAGAAQIDEGLGKTEVLHLIALNEDAARVDETTHGDRQHLAMIYRNLGMLYGEAFLCLKAEDAMHRAIALLKDGPQDQLASEYGQLAGLHVAMNKMRAAEEDESHALRIRKALGDPVGTALTEATFAGLYDNEKKYTKAMDYAKDAYSVLADNPNVGLADRIGVRHTLGFALTGERDCDRGIGVLEDALEFAKNAPGSGTLSVGYSEYELGFGYWHCGDRDQAAKWLEHGTADMRADFGWANALYVNAMKQYARLLRENGQWEAAQSAESVVVQAKSIVDANALSGRSEGFR